MSGTRSFQGRTILVAEDDPLIAPLLLDILERAGATVLGPFPSLQMAHAALASVRPDAALLDVNLIDGDVFPLAAHLQQSEVPYVFFSASSPSHVPSTLQPRAFLKKPASLKDIVTAIDGMLEQRS